MIFAFAAKARPGQSGTLTNLAMVVVVAGVIALMILPMPALLLDSLIAVNIGVALILLLSAIYISSPVELSVFPSILLVTTVYRLSLSIAATRMILTEGQAGQVIDTFGALAAGGNLVVGLVVFLIITAVQFVVIAKGAERVAEVSARFSLDSMPGKQLSIDSDLRSGLIEKEEARRRRRVLDLETRLHGGLEGAMKFVRGDAVAGIVIVAVNLVGGLLVGVLQRHLSLTEALQTYSVLTIGDGMVTQIPALLITMASGLIVTRAVEEGAQESLATVALRQLSGRPQAILNSGLLCWALALVPGFPGAVFLTLGAAFVGLGVALEPGLRAKAVQLLGPATALLGTPAARRVDRDTVRTAAIEAPAPLELQLAAPLWAALPPEALRAWLTELLEEFQASAGVTLPPVTTRLVELSGADWRLLAYDLPIATGAADPTGSTERLRLEVRTALRRHIGKFVGMQETSAMLARTSVAQPELVKEIQRARPLPKIAEVLRRLAAEEVPLRNLQAALEALAGVDPSEKDPVVLTEIARIAMREHITHRYAPDGVLRALTLAPETITMLQAALTQAGPHQRLALAPAVAKRLIGEVAKFASDARVLLAPMELRRHLRTLIAPDLFDLPVLGMSELSPTLRLEVVRFIKIAPADVAAA